MPKALILYSSRSEDQVFAQEVAGIAGLEFVPAAELEQAVTEIQNRDVGATIIDASYDEKFYRFEKLVQEKIGLFSDKVNTNHFHFLASEDLESLNHLTQSPLFGNFILRKFKTAEQAQAAGRRYGYTVKASLNERAFGLKNFFSEKSQIQTIKLKKSTQKQQIVEAIRSYLVKARYPSRMANVIANAVDELIMNACFTAPVDELGHRTYDQTPRDTELVLEGKQAVEVTVAFDGSQVGISVLDNYGAIDKEKLIFHLATVYNEDAYKVKTSVAGAGIGLATTFRSGGSLVFICEKNSRTEVAVIFERFDNYREFKDQFRYVSLQYYL